MRQGIHVTFFVNVKILIFFPKCQNSGWPDAGHSGTARKVMRKYISVENRFFLPGHLSPKKQLTSLVALK